MLILGKSIFNIQYSIVLKYFFIIIIQITDILVDIKVDIFIRNIKIGVKKEPYKICISFWNKLLLELSISSLPFVIMWTLSFLSQLLFASYNNFYSVLYLQPYSLYRSH